MTNSLRLIAVIALPACSSLTDVQAPDVTGIDELSNIAGADVLRNGAWIRLSYTDAYQAYFTGLVSDEFTSGSDSDLADGRAESITYDPARGIGTTMYLYAQQARVNSLQALPVMQKYYPASRRSDIGRIFAVAGFAELYMGEAMCSGVPLSYADVSGFTYGSPISSDSMLKVALAHFDSGLVYAADSVRILNFVRVGRARTLQQLNRHADAAATVAAVPTTYVLNTDFVATAITNVVYSAMSGRTFGVADKEGINGLDFISAGDPRVQTVFVGLGANGYTQINRFAKYSGTLTQFPIASGIEARLIEAETMLAGGNAAGALAKLNDLRATQISPALAPLTDAGTPAARLDQLMRERAFWLYATGHRLGDLRRLVRQYGRATESVFPTGVWRQGTTYGKGVALTASSGEGVNPNYVGSKCDNTVP